MLLKHSRQNQIKESPISIAIALLNFLFFSAIVLNCNFYYIIRKLLYLANLDLSIIYLKYIYLIHVFVNNIDQLVFNNTGS